MIEINLIQLRDWARECGVIALKHFRHAVVTQKADRSFVTAADIEIEQPQHTPTGDDVLDVWSGSKKEREIHRVVVLFLVQPGDKVQ